MQDVINDQHSNDTQPASRGPVKVIAIAGSKGGIGKTNIAVNLAIAFAENRKKVILLDGDFGLANVHVLLGLKNKKNIADFFDDKVELEELLLEGPKGIKIIPAANGVEKMTALSTLQHSGFINSFCSLTTEVDVLIIDTASGISNQVINLLKASQEIIIAVGNEPASINDTYSLIKLMRENHGVRRFYILANMTGNSAEGQELFNKLNKFCTQFLDVILQFDGCIPYDTLLKRAILQQQAVIESYPDSRSAAAFRQLCKKIMNRKTDHGAKDEVCFFMEKLMAANTSMLA